MKKLLFILVILALCAVLAAGGALALARVQNARLDVTEYALSPDGLPAAFDGFTIAQLITVVRGRQGIRLRPRHVCR